jgi:hypothetical protein
MTKMKIICKIEMVMNQAAIVFATSMPYTGGHISGSVLMFIPNALCASACIDL